MPESKETPEEVAILILTMIKKKYNKAVILRWIGRLQIAVMNEGER